jgi:hypothetical protein
VKSRVHELLSNPFYIGKFSWNGEIYQGKHEPLILEETFDRIQRILHGKTAPKYSKHSYLYKAMLRCVECGGLITWEEHKGTPYGHCNGYRECHSKKWLQERKLTSQVVATLTNLELKDSRMNDWFKRLLKDDYKTSVEDNGASINELNRQLKRADSRIAQLYDDKVDGLITSDFYKTKNSQYTKDKNDIVKDIGKVNNASDVRRELSVTLYDLSQDGGEIFHNKENIDDKRQLLKLIFDEMKLDKTEFKYKFTAPFQILADIAEKANSSKTQKTLQLHNDIFEPASQQVQMARFRAACPTLLRRPDSDRRPIDYT